MADKQISELTAGTNASAALFHGVEGDNSRRFTGAQIRGGWVVAQEWTHSANVANVDFTGLAGATDILVIVQDITFSVSGRPTLRVSVDNGATFFTTSGDYRSIQNTGQADNNDEIITSDTSATVTRSSIVHFVGVNSGGPVFIDRVIRSSDSNTGMVFVGSTSPINALRVYNFAGGNITGGKITVLTR